MRVASYRDLKVWQASMDRVEPVYGVDRGFPVVERYALSSPLQRSVVSIPSDLAEGHARSTTRDYLRYAGMARGSLADVRTRPAIAARLHYMDAVTLSRLPGRSDAMRKMLRGLRTGLERAARRGPLSIPDPRSSTRSSNAEA